MNSLFDLRNVLLIALLLSVPMLAEDAADDDEVALTKDAGLLGQEAKFRADSFSLLKNGSYEFTGNVEVIYGDIILHAEEATYDPKLKIVESPQWTHLKYKNIDIIGEGVVYNMETQAGQFENAHLIFDAGPFKYQGRWYERKWYVYGKKVIKDPGVNAFHVEDGRATTCPPEYQRPLYYIQGKRISVLPGNKNDPTSVARIVAQNCFLKFEEVPIMWLPQISYELRDRDDQSPIQVIAGYTSQQGGFFDAYLDVFRNQFLKVTPHLGYYSKHGIAFGVDGAYNYQYTNVTTIAGAWKTFFLEDKSRQFVVGEQKTSDKVNKKGESGVSMFRYRFLWEHGQTFGPGAGWLNESTLMGEMDLLSDIDLVQDFYYDDYKTHGPRDTYIDFTKPLNEDNEVSVYMVKQINDFYTTYERLPELRHIFRKRRIMEIPSLGVPVFYESRTRAGWYNYLESDNVEGNTSYSVWKAWTDQKISAPKRFFGFFNFEPFLGVASEFGGVTSYERGRVDGTFTKGRIMTYTERQPTIFSLFDYNRFSRVPINMFSDQETGGLFHMVPYAGIDTSFKMVRTYDMEGTYAGQLMRKYLSSDNEKLRHIIEPKGRLLSGVGFGTDSGAVLGWDEGVRTAFQVQRNGHNADLLDITFMHSIRMRGGELFDDQTVERRYRYYAGRGYIEYDKVDTYTPRQAMGFNANAEPLDWLQVGSDFVYDMDEIRGISLVNVNSHADLSWAVQRAFASPYMTRSLRGRKDELNVDFGYRYVHDDASEISIGGRIWFDDFTPLLSREYQDKIWAREWTRGWGVGAGVRYDTYYRTLEEVEYTVYKNWKKCLDTAITYRYRDDNDYALMASFWLTAYPQMKVGNAK